MRDAFWPGTLEAPAPVYPALAGEVRCDFAVVGGGYTGLSAALVLAGAGADVVLVDANRPGWGASGRNGGLVSAGSSKLDDATIRARHGETQARAFFDAERAAVDHVADLLETHGIEADRQSDGYTFAAHSPRAMADVQAYGDSYRTRYGLEARVLDRDGMAAAGMASPDLHGGVTVPVGFAINPMKFVTGLTRAAERAGVRIFSDTPVTGLEPGHVLRTPGGAVRARGVLFGLNGYASEATPPGMAARYLPVQSNILVSRVLSEDEIAAQGGGATRWSWIAGRCCITSAFCPTGGCCSGCAGRSGRRRTASHGHGRRRGPISSGCFPRGPGWRRRISGRG
ncbi:MAG: NAD(P)/FAD-dependent oxidoreductase [Paracoccaceae bacterium]